LFSLYQSLYELDYMITC